MKWCGSRWSCAARGVARRLKARYCLLLFEACRQLRNDEGVLFYRIRMLPCKSMIVPGMCAYCAFNCKNMGIPDLLFYDPHSICEISLDSAMTIWDYTTLGTRSTYCFV